MFGVFFVEFFLDFICGFVGDIVAGVLGWLWRAYARTLNVPILVAVLLDCLAGTAEGVRLFSQGTSLWFVALGAALVIGCPALAVASTMAVWRKINDERKARRPVDRPLVGWLQSIDLRPAREMGAAGAPHLHLPPPAPPYTPWGWSDRTEIGGGFADRARAGD
ncbi:MAG TPA: hypothetical protein VF092_15270 [Longimicrobium sp.]